MAPRDPGSAASALLLLCVVTALLSVFTVGLDFATVGQPRAVAVAVLAALGLLAVLRLRAVDDPSALAWTAAPALFTGWIVALAFVADVPAAPAELLLIFPGAYLSRQLARPAALASIAALTGCVPVLVFARLDGRAALLQTGYVVAVLLAVLVRLTITGHRYVQRLSAAEAEAKTDRLTGLATRHSLQSAVARVAAGPAGVRGHALMLVDIDHFKQVNDTFGHPAGDEALTTIARLVLDRCRVADIAARIGGDEIALFLTDIPASAALGRAESLRCAVERVGLPIHGRCFGPLSVSVGVVHSSGPIDLDAMYADADRALYEAKKSGRNAVRSADGQQPARRTGVSPVRSSGEASVHGSGAMLER